MDCAKSVLNIQCLIKKSVSRGNFGFFAYLFYASFLIATSCVKSPSPVADELLKVSAPYFGLVGQMTTIISSPTINYTLVGTCDDTNGYLTEWSLNQTTWTEVPCTNKQFSIPLVLTTRRTVYARSRGKFIYSEVAKAIVRLLLPPTSDVVTHVASARSDDTDGAAQGTENFLSINWSSTNSTNGIKKLSSGVPRLVYEP